MPRLPDVQSLGARPTPGAPRALSLEAPQEAVDTAVGGEVMADVGQQMTQAATRMFDRQDAVDRARLFSAYNEQAATELRRLETEADLSRSDVVQQYGQFLKEKQGELIGQHRGSSLSRASLMERFEGVRSTYAGEIAGKSVAAQRKLVQDQLGQTVGTLAANAYDAPQSIGDLFASLDDIVADLGPAISEEEARAYKTGGRAEIAASAAESFLDNGAMDQAEELLASPDVQQVLPANLTRRLRSRITVQRVTEERERNELSRRQKQIEGLLGRSLSQTEKLNLVGLAPQPRAATIADKIREFEAAVQRPATEQEIAGMYGVDTATSTEQLFGGGMQGRALAMVTDLAPMYAAGLTSPEQERQLEAAMAAMRQPDPITGLRMTEPPPFLADALRARGVDPQRAFEQQTSIVGQFGQTALEVGGSPDAITPEQLETPQAPGAAPVTQPPEQPAAALPNELSSERTIWERAGSLAGPVAAATEVGRAIPGVSGFIPGSETVQDRAFARNFQRGVVTALQQSPRYAEGEREAIAQEVQILGRLLDTEENYQDKLIGLDESLKLRQQTAEETAADRSLPADVRRDASAVANLVQQVRQTIGVPPLVNTPDEARALPPGTVFRNPRGDVLVVPNGG